MGGEGAEAGGGAVEKRSVRPVCRPGEDALWFPASCVRVGGLGPQIPPL